MNKRVTPEALNCREALEIVHLPIESLHPAQYNPRRMAPQEMGKLRRSVERFGVVEPIVVRREGNIVVGGHQRLEAAKQLGLKTVPVVFVDLGDAEAKLLNLALNKIAGEWDTVRLASLLSELRTLPTPELELSGFLKDEASAIIRCLDWGRRPDPDVLPEPPERLTTKPGDIWCLGEHLVCCADCTDRDAVWRLVADGQVDMLFSDPPFGISYDPAARPGSRSRTTKMEGDSLPDDACRILLERSLRLALQAARPGAPAYLFYASTQAEAVLGAFRTAGWRLAAGLIWVKAAPTFTRSDYHWQHEPLLYGWKPGGRHRWFGGRRETSVWQMGRDGSLPDLPHSANTHPTQKPVALVERAITNSSRPGDIVYDPFVGSGTTIIACERLARRCLAIEIEPRFVDMAVARWERYTGQKAELTKED
jgi:DNA modification methylase